MFIISRQLWCYGLLSTIRTSGAYHYFLPAVFVFVLVGEFVNVSVSVFVFVDVPLLVALFVMVGLLVLVIPRVFMVSRKNDSRRTYLKWWWCWARHSCLPGQKSAACSEARLLQRLLLCTEEMWICRIFHLFCKDNATTHLRMPGCRRRPGPQERGVWRLIAGGGGKISETCQELEEAVVQ